jgi:hypothetical protein
MTSMLEWAEMTPANVGAVARGDLGATLRLATGGNVEPRLYLYRLGRLEVERLPPDWFEDQRPAGFVRPRYLPLLATLGRIEIIALAFAARSEDVPSGEAMFVHVLDATRHDSWAAEVRRDRHGRTGFGPWCPGSPQSLSERAICEIRSSLAG